jgi:pyrroline-5-carboxylate reductase
MLDNKRIGFLGGGVMASALIDGIIRAQLISANQIIASDPTEASRYI